MVRPFAFHDPPLTVGASAVSLRLISASIYDSSALCVTLCM